MTLETREILGQIWTMDTEFWADWDKAVMEYYGNIPKPEIPKPKVHLPVQMDGRAKRRERRKMK